jgi:ligand-binding sensor domain-containing protein/serine phosphatase RsbU (regulator of sigma subunit)
MLLSVKNRIKALICRQGILLAFFSGLANPLFAQGYNFHTYNSGEGLPQSYVYSVMQDVHGYLWVGTGNGLSRYNGFIFENFTTNDSLADNFITCGISDGECLWFGHMNGSLSYFDGKRFKGVNIPQSSLSPVTHFAKSPDGRIWAGTFSDGILNLDKEKGTADHYMFKDQVSITSFDFLVDNEIIVGTNTGLLFCRLKEPGEIEIIRSVAEVPESKVTAILKMRGKSGFFIATENDGIFQLTNENNQLKVSALVADTESEFIGIQDIYEDSRSDLWLCSFGNGLIKVSYSTRDEFGEVSYFNTSNGFVTDNVKTVYEDREGNIWSGNYGKGLTQISPKTFSVFKSDNTLYGNDIFSFYFSQWFRWLGTENGLVKIDQLTGKVVKFYSKGSGLPKDTVTSIYSADGKELWIGTGRNGLFRMDVGNERILKYPLGNGVLENAITIIAGKDKQVWIGTKKGLCSINTDSGRIKWYTINEGGLPHNIINCLYIDKTNICWVSFPSNNLAYIMNEKVYKVPLNTRSGYLTLGPITEDKDSRIWVGSNGNGVFMIESDSIVNLTTNEGLLSNYCYSLFCDDNRNIWIGHKGGLSRIRSTDFQVKPVKQFEDITDSYEFNPNAIIKDEHGKIWFGSGKGLISYDPSIEYSRLLAPVLGITSIRINDEETDYADKLILPPGSYKIRIDFLGVSLKEPALVSYQYKLEGYDQWSETTKSTNITYNNLKGGNYTFILKASSGDGVVSENPLTLNIVIKMPVWKKWWFYFLLVLILTILTFIYIKRREHKFLVEKKILEEKVLERTYEIQRQKNEIELQRDIIEEKNANITSSIEYASHIQNAILPPLEFINKLLPDNFILSKPKDIVSGDFFWLAEKDDKIIFTVADCTGHGVAGAFMSLLGITLLNDIVNIEGITRSDAIVTRLRERVIVSLQQGRKDITTSNGIDMALCVMDRQQKRIQFTGGFNDLVYIRDGELSVLKSDRFSVCFFIDYSGPFTMQEIEFRKGDVFYLFSDGYKDQFGGDHNKKYMGHNFYSTLLEIHKLPMPEQKEMLEKELIRWKKDNVQTDDITVMGIRM